MALLYNQKKISGLSKGPIEKWTASLAAYDKAAAVSRPGGSDIRRNLPGLPPGSNGSLPGKSACAT